MKEHYPHTAILLFSRTSTEESRMKDFSHGKGGSVIISKALFDHTFSECQKSGMPVIVHTEKDQRGETFGEKLSHAFQSAFDKGFQRVICIGNDCPELSFRDLRRAAAKLSSADAVLGPSKDGGMYLIGLKRSVFQPTLFTRTKWQQGEDFEQFRSGLETRGFSVFSLNKKTDVDHFKILSALASENHLPSLILSALKKILTAPSVRHTFYLFHIKLIFCRSGLLRAPPFFIA